MRQSAAYSWFDELVRKGKVNAPGASLGPREELDALLDAALRLALRLVEKHGCHIPFAFTVTTAGNRTDIAADNAVVTDAEQLFTGDV